jgi:hypothetical protein
VTQLCLAETCPELWLAKNIKNNGENGGEFNFLLISYLLLEQADNRLTMPVSHISEANVHFITSCSYVKFRIASITISCYACTPCSIVLLLQICDASVFAAVSVLTEKMYSKSPMYLSCHTFPTYYNSCLFSNRNYLSYSCSQLPEGELPIVSWGGGGARLTQRFCTSSNLPTPMMTADLYN